MGGRKRLLPRYQINISYNGFGPIAIPKKNFIIIIIIMTLIQPNALKNNRIAVERVVQSAGDIIITFPRGYHSGFNLGFNIAKAINFASPEWVKYGATSTQCTCSDRVQVTFSMQIFSQFLSGAVDFKHRDNKRRRLNDKGGGVMTSHIVGREQSQKGADPLPV